MDEIDLQSILLLFVIVLIIVIFIFVYGNSSRSSEINKKISELNTHCPEPVCPEPKCPEHPGCPEVKCPENGKCPPCPQCPDCGTHDYPTVDEIVDGIFPGRDPRFRMSDQHFPVAAMSESCPQIGSEYGSNNENTNSENTN